MTSLRFLVAALVGAAVLTLAGVLIYGIAFPSFYPDFMAAGGAVGVERQPMLGWALAVGMVSYSALITASIVGARVRTIAAAAGVGALVSFLMWFSADVLLFAVSNVGSLSGVLLDPLLKLVPAAVAGSVIGFTLGMRPVGRSAAA